jgi:GNAT superfamily N-acetyltransferase
MNEIIDTAPLETLIEELDDFKAHTKYLCKKYAMAFICFHYIDAVINDERVITVFRCLDQDRFNIMNCPSIMSYRKVAKPSCDEYYILLICTSRKYKGQGYASQLLNDFIDRIRGLESPKGSATEVLIEVLTEAKYEIPTSVDQNFVVQRTDAKRPKKIILSSVETAVTFYEEYGFKWTKRPLSDYPVLMRYEKWDKEKEYFMMELDVE